MTWEYDGLMLLVACAAAAACALPGVFLVVRGMGLMGDAISHAVLPGIAVGFLISGSRESVWMFGGAAVAGVLAAAPLPTLVVVVPPWNVRLSSMATRCVDKLCTATSSSVVVYLAAHTRRLASNSTSSTGPWKPRSGHTASTSPANDCTVSTYRNM